MRFLPRAAAKLLSIFLCRYFRLAGPSLQVNICLPDGSIHANPFDDVYRFVDSQHRESPAIYLFWTSEHLNLLSLGFTSPQLHLLSRQFEFFADDSLGGLVMRACITSLNLKTLPISEDPVQRLKLLRSVFERRPAAVLIVDGRGPYFTVASGVVNLGRTIKAPLIPCAVAADRRLLLPNIRVPISIPMPYSRLLLYIGTPIDPMQFVSEPQEGARRVGHMLMEARRKAYGLLNRSLRGT